MSMNKFCKKCNCETTRRDRGDCIPCDRKRSADRYSANPEKEQKRVSEWNEKNRDKLRLLKSDWEKNNQEKVIASVSARLKANPNYNKERSAAYRAANATKIKEANALWSASNAEQIAANHSAWKKANPELVRIQNQNRRAKKMAAGGKLSKGLAEKLFNLQGGKCPACKANLSNSNPRSPLDHVIALASGGSNSDKNIQMLCRKCNQEKHTKDPIAFMQSKGFLI